MTNLNSVKKVVHYSRLAFTPRIGGSAVVLPVDHPDTENVSNTCFATTSEVLRMDDVTGVFETLNTIYVPQPVTYLGPSKELTFAQI